MRAPKTFVARSDCSKLRGIIPHKEINKSQKHRWAEAREEDKSPFAVGDVSAG